MLSEGLYQLAKLIESSLQPRFNHHGFDVNGRDLVINLGRQAGHTTLAVFLLQSVQESFLVVHNTAAKTLALDRFGVSANRVFIPNQRGRAQMVGRQYRLGIFDNPGLMPAENLPAFIAACQNTLRLGEVEAHGTHTE